MPTISDLIEAFLKQLINDSLEKSIEIQRNDLAKEFDCAPSQINYVLTTRFTIKNGYVIESQRGGGGYIRIKKLVLRNHSAIYQIIIKEIGDRISQSDGNSILQFLMENKRITKREAKLMGAALEDSVLEATGHLKNQIRAKILKSMLITLLEEA